MTFQNFLFIAWVFQCCVHKISMKSFTQGLVEIVYSAPCIRVTVLITDSYIAHSQTYSNFRN